MSAFNTAHRVAHPRHGIVTSVVVASVCLALALFAAWFFLGRGASEPTFAPLTATVDHGEFVAKVLDQGEIQSSSNAEIRCEVRSRNGKVAVISVIPEGTRVTGGDFLVQLDSSQFEKELQEQKIKVSTARTTLIKAKTALASAEATRNEYVQGLFPEQQKTIENEIYEAESEIKTAESELEQAGAVLEHSRKLQAKGFITRRQLDADDFNVAKAKISLKKAKNLYDLSMRKLEVLEDISYKKELISLDSDIEAATVELASEEDSLQVELRELEEIQEMIRKCEVRVPEGLSGQVVYAKERSRGGDDWVLQEGVEVRESQVLVRLPDPDQMEVNALINEQSITLIENGMPATIEVDALNNITLKGVVTRVSQYAESSGWMSTTVRKYGVLVRIIDPPVALKPGMNCSVSIQTRYEPDALMVPLQAVYGVQEQQFCLVKTPAGEWVTREVKIGGDNSQMAMVSDGLTQGEEVVLNPGQYKSRMDLPEVQLDSRIEIPDGEEGDAKGKKPESPSGRAGAGGPGGGPTAGGPGGGPTARATNGPRPSAAGIVDMIMKRSDTNSDGTIDADELGNMEGRSKSSAEAADSDGDGSISRAELLKAMEKRMQQGGGGPGAGGRGGGGGGRPRGGANMNRVLSDLTRAMVSIAAPRNGVCV